MTAGEQVEGMAAEDGAAGGRARSRRTRMIVLGVLAALVVLWFVPGGAVSWVRPALLALAAGVVAVWYWRRSGSHARRAVPEAPRAEDTRDVWDALDRGEDLTDETRV
ncbi:Trp biosynthesis-associated membrane protein [Catellatospora paridis]|uniref:Trp biosynthesis-associated membrane protein n=1 Tax=Catellatospora paridis TaxID=1617086 RepID=UPI0012D4B276|nr:Trp biosynthesis-associated membrane protein [Catellatospora paridis]